MHTIRVFEWNVNGAGPARRGRQAEFLSALEADVVVLTEVRHGAADEYLEALAAAGLTSGADSFDGVASIVGNDGRRRYGVVIASRWDVGGAAPVQGAPWPERTLEAHVARDAGPIHVIAVYAPLGRHGDAKSATFEAIGTRLGELSGPTVLAGDFNAPRFEGIDDAGEPVLVTFGQSRFRDGGFGRPGHRQDVAERLVLDGSPVGLVDAFRSIHGYGTSEFSWSTIRSGVRWDYRLDHVLVRGGLQPATASYRQELREPVDGRSRLSDHAALEVSLHTSGR